MGMGDAGRNLDAVTKAVRCLTDRDRFCFAQSKVTVSTVGPTPSVFQAIADVPCTIAWSLHAANDDLRKRLVPSTKHSTVELRDGLTAALATRPTFKSRTMYIYLPYCHPPISIYLTKSLAIFALLTV
jgi:23S rRNA (adenine2503-C2)-methyltransferase